MSDSINLEKTRMELLNGNPIFVFDDEGRESETDIFFSAKSVTSDNLHYLRKNGGSLKTGNTIPEWFTQGFHISTPVIFVTIIVLWISTEIEDRLSNDSGG